MAGYAADGTKRWELEGTQAMLHGDAVTIQHPHAIGYEPTRSVSLTASLAHVQQASHRILLEHNVTIHTSDGLWLETPTMYWVPDTDEVVTDQPASLETDRMLLYGREVIAHTHLKTAVFQHDIELVISQRSNAQWSGMMSPGASGRAQTSGAPAAANADAHVTITCDGPLTLDSDRQIATFEHHVHVQDRQGDLYSDKLVAYLHKTTRTIAYAEASGHVRIQQGPHTAHGERAVYEPARSKITLLGAPSLLVSPHEQSPGVGGSLGTVVTR